MALTPEQRRQRARRTNLLMAYAAAFASTKAWTPAQLATGASAWAWYDFSDLSSMFRDSAGTTPVTAVEQPIGLILDKSRGLSVGVDLISNGDFSSGTTGWTLAAGTASVTSSGGGMEVNASVTAYVVQSFTTVVGRFYHYSVQIVSQNGAAFNGIRKADNNTASVNVVELRQGIANGVGTSTGVFAATATTTFIVVQANSGAIITVDNISVRELPGNHATQSTAAARPIYRVDGSGRGYAAFDGTDDSLATGTINPGSVDKVQVFAGVRKLSDAAVGMVVETSNDADLNDGTFFLTAPRTNAANYGFRSKGTVLADAQSSAVFAAPRTDVLTGIGDISGDISRLRINGVQAAETLTDQGTGNFLSYTMNIGSRAGSSLRLNGWLYGLIVRFSAANLDSATITQAETWMNGKTGAF